MTRHFLGMCLAMSFCAALSRAADWPVFHNLNGDNKSSETGLLQKWPEGGPKLLWTADFIGFGYSGVSIAGERIYISGNLKRDGKDLAMVFCLDQDGKKIWEQDNGLAHTTARTYPSTRGTPTIDGNFVYDVSALGLVTCFDARTGAKKWSRDLMKDYNAPMPMWLLGHSVVVDGERLICMVGGAKALAVALDKKTGQTLQEFPPSPESAEAATGYATPYFFEHEGRRILAVMSNITVEGYDITSGKLLFTIPWRNRTRTNVTMPIYHEGYLFLSSGYGFGSKLYKLANKADNTLTATEVWYEPRLDNHHGGVIRVGDYVYGTSHQGSWGALNFRTGEIGYLERSIGSGSVHYADGLIYGFSEKNKTVILLKPDPNEYIELSRFELPNQAEGMSWAHPVVCNGKLYLRHAQYLYCYDVKAE